jgi:hypothetical protein
MPCNASYTRFIFGKFFICTIIWYALLCGQNFIHVKSGCYSVLLWYRNKLIFLTLGWSRAAVAAVDGGLSPSSLSEDDRLLWWRSNDEEGTGGSGRLQGSFRNGQLGTGGSTPARRRARAAARAWSRFYEIEDRQCLFIGNSDLRHRGRGI